MFTLNKNHKFYIFVALAATMYATRGHHLDATIGLPDASLAVFFVAGILYLRNLGYMLGLLIVAGLTDYIAFQSGVSDWCFTPGYWFLIPTYAAMWGGGFWFSKIAKSSLSSLGYLGLILFGSTLTAFVISNYSFYFFAEYFSKISFLQYSGSILEYFPPYMGFTFMYISVVTVVTLVFKSALHWKTPVKANNLVD